MEYLLNHSNLCVLIYSGQYQEALRAFENHYIDRLQNACLAHLKLYLSSLNQSISLNPYLLLLVYLVFLLFLSLLLVFLPFSQD